MAFIKAVDPTLAGVATGEAGTTVTTTGGEADTDTDAMVDIMEDGVLELGACCSVAYSERRLSHLVTGTVGIMDTHHIMGQTCSKYRPTTAAAAIGPASPLIPMKVKFSPSLSKFVTDASKVGQT